MTKSPSFSEATARPWTIDPEYDGQSVLGPDGVQVADCSIFVNPKFGKWTDKINAANAALIVHSVNHMRAVEAELDRLREALEKIEQQLEYGQNHIAHRIARAALQKEPS